ncbi:hypothetical protein KSP40_PGU004060 [Platanthera guangdongensis]|uniref:Succinate dehydrogenase assembly factor 2, mitochondrial n=1 Tax=Platanthera guangdongensis TaxID=2320717 RepID=A0ABR2N1G4_9ASPA
MMAFLHRSLIFRIQQALTSNSMSSLNRHNIGSLSHFSSESGPVEINLSDDESMRCLHNRSRQRGFLELDLVLGKWVEENIRSMDEAKIRSLVDVLDLVELSSLVSPPPARYLWTPSDEISTHYKVAHNKDMKKDVCHDSCMLSRTEIR